MTGRGRGLTRAVLGTLAVVAALTLAAAFAFGGEWPRAWWIATGVATLAVALTLPVLLSALRLEPALAGPRVLAAGGLRALVVLVGAVVAHKGFGVAKVPIFALTLAYYVGLLAAETLATSRAFAKGSPTAAETVPQET